MKIAIPLAEGVLARHFGHCEQFALVDVIELTGEIVEIKLLTPPPHEPGVLPRWLGEKGANIIIAGGMGQKAQSIFKSNGINVIVGVNPLEPEEIISEYFNGSLAIGENCCDH